MCSVARTLPLSVGRIYGQCSISGGIPEFFISMASCLGHHDLPVYFVLLLRKSCSMNEQLMLGSPFLGVRL